jgi:tetratricopeptide (TPR) repeat protein
MSPEQVRGEQLDARNDVFSLGTVMYEMISGHHPFAAENTASTLAAILTREPPLLARYLREVPTELERILTKALNKNKEERYQVMKDMALDLKSLAKELEFEAKLERSISPDTGGAAGVAVTASRKPSDAAGEPAARSGKSEAVEARSSIQYIVSAIERHKLATAIILASLIVVAVAANFLFVNRATALTDKDTILLTDWTNTTGDAVFDGTLKQGLAVQLSQSPFLNLFPDTRVRETLRLMGRSPDERVTQEIGQEICQRQGLKCLVVGSIAPLGSHYVLTLEAINSQSGEALAREQVEAEGKEQVLKTLGQAATRLREHLGESLSSIQRFDASLELTTSSLEALKAYSLGYEQSTRGSRLESIPFYKRATELDPKFASAYLALAVQYGSIGQPKLAAEYAEKAFPLRDRVSEPEKFRISFIYYSFVTGEAEKAIEMLDLYRRTYPRDARAHNNLAVHYEIIGQFDRAVERARESLRLDPNRAVGYSVLARCLIRLNRLEEARELVAQAQHQKLDATSYHTYLYQIAFINGDATAMQQELTWASGKPDEHVALDWQTQTAAFAGQWKRAQELARRAIDLAAGSAAKENAAQYTSEAALRGMVFGHCAQTKAAAAEALSLERNQVSLTRAALALALCGESSQAQSLLDELKAQYPKDTVVQMIWLPTVRAAIELQRGNAAHALELSQPALRYEAAAEFWPQYVRGLAYLKLGKGTEAAAEFQKILGSRGQAPLSALYPPAHLGVARATVMEGNAAKGRQSYQDFFTLWKDADTDIPILIEAKKEYEQLK